MAKGRQWRPSDGDPSAATAQWLLFSGTLAQFTALYLLMMWPIVKPTAEFHTDRLVRVSTFCIGVLIGFFLLRLVSMYLISISSWIPRHRWATRQFKLCTAKVIALIACIYEAVILLGLTLDRWATTPQKLQRFSVAWPVYLLLLFSCCTAWLTWIYLERAETDTRRRH